MLGILLLGTFIVSTGQLGWWLLAGVYTVAAVFAVPLTHTAHQENAHEEYVRAEAPLEASSGPIAAQSQQVT